ncbi:Cytochrome P450 [Macrophomina phaseolina MS6]|uniref:Cytochrome P450 n=1 Tax=Macrophomina phaseolina (strain MS6) TaxID=1126212 RepID=K2QIA8_MACPH|nr:Cytochrome P450 [Macrophomina phaseolina MS6]
MTRLPYAIDLARGDLVKTATRLHEQYGDVVRIAPGELSFISGETAWSDIYGFRGGKSEELGKDLDWYLPAPNGTRSLLSAFREDHSRFRRVFSHAFSDRALREQEPLVQRYVDMLLQRLREHAGQAVDMVRYYNFTTFDIIGDLTFNESFGCLESDDYHSLVAGAFASVRAISFRLAIHYYKLAERLYFALRPNGIHKGSSVFFDFTAARVDKRVNTDTNRPDFITFVERQSDSKSLRDEELKANCYLFLIAGSETTATTLSGTTYLLLKNPQALARLTAEVRDCFTNSDDITFEAAAKLPYLQAVLNEGLRLYPPVPTGFPRTVPRGGVTVSGHFIPEKVRFQMAEANIQGAAHGSRQELVR